jgi:hypothetical protein
VGNNDETPDVPDEAEQTTVEAEEDVEKDVAAKPEGGRIS